jgi:hypothetical protein
LKISVSMAQVVTGQGRAKRPTLRRQLQGDWVELESVDGEIYYANVATKETSWELPTEALSGQDAKENDENGPTAGKHSEQRDDRCQYACGRVLRPGAASWHECF